MDSIKSMLSDGSTGMPISLMRVIVLIIIVAVIGSKFWNSYWTKTPIVWDTQDFEMLGMAFGSKLIQNSQEHKDVQVNLTAK